MKKNMLVTSALPYANGSIHLGHLVEYIQTDIWVRFQKMLGNQCLYICGSDCHGTPIMLRAEKENISPEELVLKMHDEQANDLKAFLVEFDNYYLTHSKENRELANLIYEKLNARGDITKKTIEQAYDAEKNIFLPDRFVRGECPKCGAKDQYGDNCEACGATYAPTDLINPLSVLTNTKPITKTSEHYFFALPHYKEALEKWIHADHVQEEVANKLEEWFEQGLQDWDISRDAPYFGFEIPNAPGKYFYVWLDAPIGYLASLKNLCDKREDLNFDDYWKKDSTIDLYHFIGKDVLYFHTLFWPAILMGANLRTPTAVYVHGFLTINGKKMSKSRGTFINARKYLEHLDPEYLRYYFASKLTSNIEDIDLNVEDFRLKVNADLVGKVVNIASRSAKFINQYFNNKLSSTVTETALFKAFVDEGNNIATCYEQREYAHAIRIIMSLADKANQYIDEQKPWKLIKETDQQNNVHNVCSLCLNLFRLLIIYLKPVLPVLAEKTENFLNIPSLNWEDHKTPLVDHTIKEFSPLMQRIETASIDNIMKE